MALALTRTSQTKEIVFSRDPDVVPPEDHLGEAEENGERTILAGFLDRQEAQVVDGGDPTVFTIRPLTSSEITNIYHGATGEGGAIKTALDTVELGLVSVSGAPDGASMRDVIEGMGDMMLLRTLSSAILGESLRGSGSTIFRGGNSNKSRKR